MQFHRSSGILLHPTSFPGPDGIGDLGAEAFRFVDWLALAHQELWQILPMGPGGPGELAVCVPISLRRQSTTDLARIAAGSRGSELR